MSYQKTDKDRARNAERKKEWYKENRQEQYARIKRNQQRVRRWFVEYKKTLSCEKCGENHPAVLDFHHKDPKQKEANLSSIWLKGWGIERILNEIENCEVLCANCHRKHHWEEKHGLVSPHSDKVLKG